MTQRKLIVKTITAQEEDCNEVSESRTGEERNDQVNGQTVEKERCGEKERLVARVWWWELFLLFLFLQLPSVFVFHCLRRQFD